MSENTATKTRAPIVLPDNLTVKESKIETLEVTRGPGRPKAVNPFLDAVAAAKGTLGEPDAQGWATGKVYDIPGIKTPAMANKVFGLLRNAAEEANISVRTRYNETGKVVHFQPVTKDGKRLVRKTRNQANAEGTD